METKRMLFILIVFSFFNSMNYAQIKVLPNGKIGAGTAEPQYGTIEIGKSGVNSGLAIYDKSTNLPPLKFYTSDNCAYLNFGTMSRGLLIRPNGRFTIGATSLSEYADNSLLNLYIHPSTPTAALTVYANQGHELGDVVKVYSNRHTDMTYVVRDLSGVGDVITFYVQGDGSVYSKGSLLTASDISFKEDIKSINNGLNVIKQMRGVSYRTKGQSDDLADMNALNAASSDTLSAQSPIPAEIVKKIREEKKREKVGFIAQELEEIFPAAVYTLPDGKKAVAYSEIIPLLVEAIKELQNEIEEMKQSKIALTRSITGDTDKQQEVSSLLDEKQEAKLYLNTPNPFKEQTTITFFLPETISQASIHIYNLQGKQMKQINIEEKGYGSVIINGYELTPGMYIYTLIVDGKEIDTKKMILTE